MRFFVLVAAAAVTGALSVVALPRIFPEVHTSMVAAVRSAGAEVAQFRLADLNPLRWDYDYVQRQVTSPDRKLDFPTTPPVVVDQSKMWTGFGSGQLSPRGGFPTSSNARSGWNGPPPHR
jgi:hypothetical protein